MTALTAQQVQANAIAALQVAAQAAIIAAMASEFVNAGLAMTAGMTARTAAGVQSARAEYEEVDEKIFKLSFVLSRYRDSVVSLRDRRTELLKQYKIAGAIPPLVQLRAKYPQLYAVERNTKKAEEQLARLELRDMLLRKRRKELAKKLGIAEEKGEIPKHVQYTQMKKFVPKTGIY